MYKRQELDNAQNSQRTQTPKVKGAEVEVSLKDKEGKVIYTERQRAKDNKLHFLKHIETPLLWSAEKPNLYQMMITLRANGQTQYICRTSDSANRKSNMHSYSSTGNPSTSRA